MTNRLLTKLGIFQKPKPNQESHQAEIEEILRKEYGLLECRAVIFGYDLRHIGIKKIKYNLLLVGIKPRDTGKYIDIKFNGRFKEFGVDNTCWVNLEN